MLYMTFPVVLCPRAVQLGRDERFDFYLTNSERAYGDLPSGVQNLLGKVSDGALDIETYGAATLRMALAGHDSIPWIIFDCRAAPAMGGPAPSYKLAAKAGLRTTPPVMLTGQGGIEAAQAMQFFAGSTKAGTGAIVSSCWSVFREVGARPVAGVVTSACLLSRLPFDGIQICVHGIGQARNMRDASAAIEIAVTDAVRKGGTSKPKWIAGAPTWAAIEPWSHCLPTATILGASSDGQPHTNFPDPLLALARYGPAIAGNEPGLLICLGKTGAVSAFIVSISGYEVTP